MKIKLELQHNGLNQLTFDNCIFIKAENDNLFMLCVYLDKLAIFVYECIVYKIKSVYKLHENKNSKFLGIAIEKLMMMLLVCFKLNVWSHFAS